MPEGSLCPSKEMEPPIERLSVLVVESITIMILKMIFPLNRSIDVNRVRGEGGRGEFGDQTLFLVIF